MNDWVLVDTCQWASFFSSPGSPEKATIDFLLDSDRVALVGPILTEVLLGFRRKDQADWVASRMRLAHYLSTDWQDWRAASELGRDLVGIGSRLPLTDLLVGVVARRHGILVYTVDPHFDRIPFLKRYWPDRAKH